MAYKLMLRELRMQKGISQKKVADQLGVVPSAVAQWELGLNNPSVANVLALADLLGCSIDELYGRSDPPESILSEEGA